MVEAQDADSTSLAVVCSFWACHAALPAKSCHAWLPHPSSGHHYNATGAHEFVPPHRYHTRARAVHLDIAPEGQSPQRVEDYRQWRHPGVIARAWEEQSEDESIVDDTLADKEQQAQGEESTCPPDEAAFQVSQIFARDRGHKTWNKAG